MAALRANARQQVGSASWIAEERHSALQVAETETEEFTFSARNELDWLNEHMAEIFSENQLNVAEIFKTPGKLRGKTPRTVKKKNPLEARVPLSDLFATTPRAAHNSPRPNLQERHVPSFRVAEDATEPPKMDSLATIKPAATRVPISMNFDSGYHGSQDSVATELDYQMAPQSPKKSSPMKTPARIQQLVNIGILSEERRTTEGSFQSAKEEQSIAMALEPPIIPEPVSVPIAAPTPQKQDVQESPARSRIAPPLSPQKRSPERLEYVTEEIDVQPDFGTTTKDRESFDELNSPSDNSSPVRILARKKSSLSFASLPAREPLTTKKNAENRISRTSHLEPSRTSYYGRHADGRSLGGLQPAQNQDDEDGMDIVAPEILESDMESKVAQTHNKTYTQRLQDQISMLGQSQTNAARPSKSISAMATAASQPSQLSALQGSRPVVSPTRTEKSFTTPGAFPDDDEDSWIGPPHANNVAPSIFSPRPMLTKSHSTDVMEGIHGKDSICGAEFKIPKQRKEEQNQQSSLREQVTITDRAVSTISSNSADVVDSPRKGNFTEATLKKGISVSNPNLASLAENMESPSPPKSPSRSYRDSPLKAAKDKLSSILKTSKGLFASSAAASAGAMASTLSPPPARIGHHTTASMLDIFHTQSNKEPLYPTLNTQPSNQSSTQADSPSKKASVRKAKEKEARDAQVIAEQLQKLERERQKESEKARVFSQQERERVAAMERQIAAQKEQDRLAKAAAATQVPVSRITRSSPRKTKAQLEAEGRAAAVATSSSQEDENVEMADAPSMAPPPTVPRMMTSQIGKPKEQAKRPVKPAKEPLAKPKQAPVVIRVNTGYRQFQPTNTALSASLQDSLPPSAPQASQSSLRGKPTPKTLHAKPSTDSMRSVASSTTKVKALEAAARKKEQDEREAQRKREAKRELASQIDAKKNAQKALEKKQQIERAKLDRPPPPAARPAPFVDLDYNNNNEKPLPQAPPHRAEPTQTKPPQRMNSAISRSQEENRLTNTFQNTTKAPPKRPLAPDDSQSRPNILRNGPSYQQNDSKRRKTIDDEDDDMYDAQPRHMAPPIRQSSIRPKDGPTKSLFSSGYATAPQPSYAPIHKAPHALPPHMQSKPAHPMDLAQNSKAAISFAPNPAHAGPSHKTPARPAGPANPGGKSTSKPATRSSPRLFQNGDNIDLPEIPTDSEDEDEDAGHDFAVLPWVNSPALNAQLVRQELIDPASVFGPPAELDMEKVFKNKERWSRFRARTSSANWSGNDRLTEEEIQRDLVARERMRRQGGWTHDMSMS